MLRRGRSPTQDIVQDARDYLGNGSGGGGDGGGMSAIGGGGEGSNGRNNSSRVQGPKPTPVLTMPVPRRGTRSASNTPLNDVNGLGTPSATTGTPTSAVTGSYMEQFERKRRKEERRQQRHSDIEQQRRHHQQQQQQQQHHHQQQQQQQQHVALCLRPNLCCRDVVRSNGFCHCGKTSSTTSVLF